MANVTPPVVEGPNLRLRPVRGGDAAYIHGLRVNPVYNTHLSSVTGTVEDQRAWIERYQLREAAGGEIYYIIERRDTDQPCGTVRLYDIEGDRFTWGSWILDQAKPPKAALESAVLVYDVGFTELGRDLAVFDVRRDNAHTLAFHRRFGAQETGSDDVNIYFTYPRLQFQADRGGYMVVLGAHTAP